MSAIQEMFGLSPEVAQAIEEMGYETPTPIQQQAIPPMLAGRDVIGQAQTGTGKTAAFGIPLVEKIDPALRRVQALVLCPTRELAMQTAGELMKLGRRRAGLIVVPVYGGQPIERQLRALQNGAQVVVGTPGRVMDHRKRGTLNFDALKLAVLDEADEMLDMGFRDDIETILSATSEARQTALFSATMPRPILALASRYLNDPVQVRIEKRELTVEKIEQCYISVRSFHKNELLSRLLTLEDIKLALVFCNTKQGVESVVTELQHRGFSAAGLHGDMRQIERDAIMARYRNGLINVLVATDVAARGLDIDNIEAVFNYDIPLDVEYYVHRIGRTGRAGKEGRAYTFVVGREVSRMWDYRRITGAKILCRKAPGAEEVERALCGRVMKEITDRAGEEHSEETRALARQLLESAEAEQAVAAMLDLLIKQAGARTDVTIDLNPPEPVRPPRPAAPSAPVRRGPYGRPVPRDMLESMRRENRADAHGDDRRAPRHSDEHRRDAHSERRYDRNDRRAGENGYERRHGSAPRSGHNGYAPRAEKRDYGARRFEKGAVRHRTGDK